MLEKLHTSLDNQIYCWWIKTDSFYCGCYRLYVHVLVGIAKMMS